MESFIVGAGVAGCRVFEGVAAWNAGVATRFFASFTGRPDFDWGRDGQPLLRSYVPALADDPGWPSELPVPDRIARVLARKQGLAHATGGGTSPDDAPPRRPAFFGLRSGRKRRR